MAGASTAQRLTEYIKAAQQAGFEVTGARIEGRVIQLDFGAAKQRDDDDPYAGKECEL